ncbi:TPA: hypothetical protein ACPSKB_003146 [Legionella feeleii]|uniref:Segregation and condensation protein B n=1 Tax=Legionella feeleii TaxID=453 RepID=A0A378J435_9GAMM|nr:hypothetical protein [Legionella feeleii]STX39054.1 Uncharacterised protein [Legionella feeleii]
MDEKDILDVFQKMMTKNAGADVILTIDEIFEALGKRDKNFEDVKELVQFCVTQGYLKQTATKPTPGYQLAMEGILMVRHGKITK